MNGTAKIAYPERPATPPAYGAETARAIADIIDAFPQRHNQDDFESLGSCGTQRCVAGWAQWLHEGRVQLKNVETVGAKYIGITPHGYDAEMLFYQVNNEQSRAALEFLANGQEINWDDIVEFVEDDRYY